MPFLMMFPGQGSQAVGMLDAWQGVPEVTQTLAEASDALDLDMAALISSGPADALNATENTQPAMLTADIALWRAWQARGGPQPGVVAGHSLGEYAALVAAGCLDFATTVKLARLRGEAMRDTPPGAMAAVVGMDDDQVAELCVANAQGQVLEPVNYNAPGQVVIAGDADAVERAMTAAKPAGARMAMRLPVSVAAHSALMQPAADKLKAALGDLTLADPAIALIQNTTGSVTPSGAEVAEQLVRQVAAPVHWVASVRAARDAAQAAVECGPGKVLCGLVKRIDRSLPSHALPDPAAMDATIEALNS